MTAVPQTKAVGYAPRMLFPRPTLPIVEVLRAELGASERQRIAQCAEKLRADEPGIDATDCFGPRVAAGLLPDAPAVLFEDYTSVALFTGRGGQQYRSLTLAGDGDTVVVGVPRRPALEDYWRDDLGFTGVTVHRLAEPPPGPLRPLAMRCLEDGDLMARLAAAARARDRLNIMPYMGTGGAWALAAEIAAHSGAEVRVAAPPPKLCQRVNDKLWFAERLRELFGRGALPVTYPAYGPAALGALIKRLAGRHRRIFVKIPDSSGSVGNLVIESSEILPLSLAEIRLQLTELLGQAGWKGIFPLAVGVWDGPVADSPSIQLWVPPKNEGPPIIQGIFSQRTRGVKGTFIGAQPSVLPDGLRDRLAHEALLLASLFQELGYFGECSFDAVLAGETLDTAGVHWIECNGRWGGVSLPMTLANRLIGDWRRRPPFIFRLAAPEGGLLNDFSEVRRRLDGHLFRPETKDTGIVIIAATRTLVGESLHMMALAESAAAGHRMAEEVAGLLGLPLE